MLNYNTLVVLIGTAILGANAGLVGSFAVLRGRSLVGDALAHAALPGLCIAFLLAGERSLPLMLLGALASGLLGVSIISILSRQTRTRDDAAVGIVLSVFFAVGIVLSGLIQHMTTGGNKAGLDNYILGQAASMLASDCYLIAGVSLVSGILVLVLFKEFELVTFDASLAQSQGWPVLWIDLTMMGLVAVTVVVGLPAVGVVLMAALLIIPPAAARMWTRSLGRLIILAAVIGAASGVLGTLVSATSLRVPTGPSIVLVAASVFLVSMLAAPERGIVSRWIAQVRFRERLSERVRLTNIYDWLVGATHPGEVDEPFIPTEDIAQGVRDSLLEPIGHTQYRLTPLGRERIVRAAQESRLWDELVATHPIEAADILSSSSDAPLNVLSPDLLSELTRSLERSGRWPSADALPELGGTA